MLVKHFYFEKIRQFLFVKLFTDFVTKKMQIFIMFQKAFKDKLTFNDIHGQMFQ